MDLLSRLLAEKEELQKKLDENAANIAELSGEDIGKSLVEPASQAIENIPPLRWLVPGLLHTVGFGVIGSAPFVGKTFITSFMAGSVSAGRPLFGSFRPTAAVPVLYLYGESSRAEFTWTLKKSLESRGIDGKNLFVKAEKVPVSRMKVGSIGFEAAIRATGAKLVIADTLAFFSGADGESNEEFQKQLIEPTVEIAERNECFILFVHHSAKQTQGVEGVYQIRGGTTLSGAADVIMRVERCKNEPPDSKRRTLHIEKVRGAPAGSIDLEFDFQHKVVWEVGQDPREILWTPQRYAAAKQADPFED